MAHSAETSSPTWHRLAQPSERLRDQWVRGEGCTQWVACGRTWDAVAITPISHGLDVLVAMRVGPRQGYPVLADHLRDQLYVLVPPGTGGTATGLPGVRVLGDGFQLLMPAGQHSSPVAHWISPPRESAPPLIRPDRLTHHLRALARDQQEAATP
ncbi:hypothetical protein GCM10010331_74440 [Streptomyces xanthochromogenes]|uniref:hypothetical protein n=1 Tax=Streptomyces xanthochromogenes TaxID=67384 RepID=UPI00167B1D18|nr:hypothetical protein [Streptomyces xanthochromogenes]GHB75732.1 hypothetical protein GCM10010331_74440 [Streptomyces xanthochromogenes]